MKIAVHPAYFSDPAEIRQEIKAYRLFPVEMSVPPVENTSHWHEFSTRIYILSGVLNITDTVLGKTFEAGPGFLVEVPERTLHSELSTQGYRIIAGMSVDPETLVPPVDLDPGLL